MKTAAIVLSIGVAVLVVAWILATNLPPASAALVFPIVGPIVIMGGGLSLMLLRNAHARRDLKK